MPDEQRLARGVRLDGEKRVQGVDTDKGFIPCGKVVNACGVWSPRAGLVVFQQVLHGAVAFGMPRTPTETPSSFPLKANT